MKKMSNKFIDEAIAILGSRRTRLYGEDFLLTWEKERDDLEYLLVLAGLLKEMRKLNLSPRCFDSGLAVSLFRDKSTRTRFSFASAANLLGLSTVDLDEEKSQVAHGETVRETAVMISFMAEFIGIRDDLYLGEGNRYMKEVGAALEEGYREKVLPRRTGVINLQCDLDHPTQTLADLLHLKNCFGSLENLRGKKIAMTWAHSPSYGKPLSVPQGIIALLTRFGMDVDLAFPEGYDLLPGVVETAGRFAAENGGRFRVLNSLEEAFHNADVVYPKSWAPLEVMKERASLLHARDVPGLKSLEKRCLEENARHEEWECNSSHMKITGNGNALYMHCLPADISGVSCASGEVSKDVFEKYRISTYKEAGFKPYVIAAIMMAMHVEDPAVPLRQLIREGRKRAAG
jgi:knotted carbamoyltransferase YgeW